MSYACCQSSISICFTVLRSILVFKTSLSISNLSQQTRGVKPGVYKESLWKNKTPSIWKKE